uniref:Uncharacterized protein n=1 Tax=Mustela putorius furo TaxID=9669 RepID=M3YLU0_MUSPF
GCGGLGRGPLGAVSLGQTSKPRCGPRSPPEGLSSPVRSRDELPAGAQGGCERAGPQGPGGLPNLRRKPLELGSPRPKPRCQLLQQAALASPVTALGLSFLLLKINSIIPPLRVMPESPALRPTRTEVLNKWWLAEHHKDTHTLTVKPPLSADRGDSADRGTVQRHRNLNPRTWI